MAFVPLTYQSCNTSNKNIQNISWRKLHYWMEPSLLTLWDRVSFPKMNLNLITGATIPWDWGSRLIKTGKKDYLPILKSYEKDTTHTTEIKHPYLHHAPQCGASESCTFQFNATVLFYFLLFSFHPCACVSWWFCLFIAVRFGDCHVSSSIRLSINYTFLLYFNVFSFSHL